MAQTPKRQPSSMRRGATLAVLLFLMIAPVIAGENRIVNPGFESGDETPGWSWHGGSLSDRGVYDWAAYNGTYGLYMEANDGGSYADGIVQAIDFTYVHNLTFWWIADDPWGMGNAHLNVYIGGVLWESYDVAYMDDWQQETINVSGYSGVRQIYFELENSGGSGSGYVFLDDIFAEFEYPEMDCPVYSSLIGAYGYSYYYFYDSCENCTAPTVTPTPTPTIAAEQTIPDLPAGSRWYDMRDFAVSWLNGLRL